MAQIIPPITSLPMDSSAAPSVEDIQDRLPSICVDYLSHDWSEEDVWASWRNMTRHKHEIANGVRLENASWRTWQKQRNKLKTISPETLNWLKDSDVTWLYGPLHTANVEPVRPLKISPTVDRLGIDNPVMVVNGPAKKPILKHRTLSEMLTIPMPSSPILESSQGDDDVDNLDELRPGLVQTKSDTNIMRSRGGALRRNKSPSRAPISGKGTPQDSGSRTPLDGNNGSQLGQPGGQPSSMSQGGTNSGKRHISFNTFVEQCMAIDDPSEVPSLSPSNSIHSGNNSGGGGGIGGTYYHSPLHGGPGKYGQNQIDSEDDDMLEMRSSSSRSSRPSFPRTNSGGSSSGGNEHLTIHKIAPTMLKTQTFANSEKLPPMVYQPPPEYLSPTNRFDNVSNNGSVDSPGIQNDLGSKGVNYDYFGGPKYISGQSDENDISYGNNGSYSPTSPLNYVAGRSPQQQQAVNVPSGYNAPTVQSPPSQPKWRQQTQSQSPQQSSPAKNPISLQPPHSSSYDSSTLSSSTSSSASLSNQSPSAQGQQSQGGQQPSRGILKVRPPGTTPPEEPPSSPPTAFFNYNPSAATGIGGLRAHSVDLGGGGGPGASISQYPQYPGSGTGSSNNANNQNPNQFYQSQQQQQQQPTHTHSHSSSGGPSPVVSRGGSISSVGSSAGTPSVTTTSAGGAGGEERGRSTSRDRGSSAENRSLSRGTAGSGTSTASISPGASRSPNGGNRRHHSSSAGIGGGTTGISSPISPSFSIPPNPPQQQGQVSNLIGDVGKGKTGAGTGVGLQGAAQIDQPRTEPARRENVKGDSEKDSRNGQGQGDEMEVDEEEYRAGLPEREPTPTPHSSPQVVFRPLKDTSPASLPHHSTRDFPQPDPAKTVSPPQSYSQPQSNASSSTYNPLVKTDSSTKGVRATTAHVGTNARPVLQGHRSVSDDSRRPGSGSSEQSTPSSGMPGGQQGQSSTQRGSGSGGAAGSAFARLQGYNQQKKRSNSSLPGGEGGDGRRSSGEFNNNSQDEDDGSSIMGRAANIANTAKDLLGALWYGANQPAGQDQGQGGPNQATGMHGRGGRMHKRGASLG